MKAVAKEERRVAYPLVLIFALIAAGIVTSGYFYYQNYEQQFRTEVERQLSAIAELKAGELEQYRKERLGDATTFFKNAAFSGLVRRFLDHPEDAETQEQLRAWLDKYQTYYQYDRVFLLDAQGVERMSTPSPRRRSPPLFHGGLPKSCGLGRLPSRISTGTSITSEFI